jgi:hypothetical protein
MRMSTRAIIWFKPTESDANEHGTWVYSHDGGDPRFVLKDLKEAHDRARAPRRSKVWPESSYDDGWKIGRPGYAASMLCGVDPPSFQVDTYWLTSGGQFYGDIEWLYLVTAEVVDGKPTWLVEVRVPKPSFWDKPTLANTRVRHRRQSIERLIEKLGPKSPSREIGPVTSSHLGSTGEFEAGHPCAATKGA